MKNITLLGFIWPGHEFEKWDFAAPAASVSFIDIFTYYCSCTIISLDDLRYRLDAELHF